MFTRILVPLDGSLLAEKAVPVAARIARATKGTVLLLRVVVPISMSSPYIAGYGGYMIETIEEERASAEVYLHRLAEEGELAGIETITNVMIGNPSPCILDFAHTQSADLIVMASHGYTGITHWTMGSVAQKVARHTTVPVLVLHPKELAGEKLLADTEHMRVLVALDGSPFAETSLLPVAHFIATLAAPGEGELHMVEVVKQFSDEELQRFKRNGFDLDLEQTVQDQAKDYLKALSEKLVGQLQAEPGVQIKVTWSIAQHRDITDELLALAKDYDLIALTTHGRSGLEHWMVGSVTERVLNHTKMPLFVVHPAKNVAGSAKPLNGKKTKAPTH